MLWTDSQLRQYDNLFITPLQKAHVQTPLQHYSKNKISLYNLQWEKITEKEKKSLQALKTVPYKIITTPSY